MKIKKLCHSQSLLRTVLSNFQLAPFQFKCLSTWAKWQAYKVYKKCLKTSKFLFKIFQDCFRRCQIPIQWRSAQEIYIPKVSTPSNSKISDFRPTALLNVESKLFFSLISNPLETHFICNNKFINNSIQKGCVEKVPVCWEDLSMVWHALKRRQECKSLL